MDYRLPVKILLSLLIAVILFHASVIVKAVPYGIAWGGRLENDWVMYVFESISILINLFLGYVLLMKGGYVKFRFKNKTTNVILWTFFSIFLLNTVGNIVAKTNFEKLFAIVTFIFA